MFEGLFQPMHLIIILAIAVVIFGPSKLPQLGAGLGKGIREFKKALAGDEKDSSAEGRQIGPDGPKQGEGREAATKT